MGFSELTIFLVGPKSIYILVDLLKRGKEKGKKKGKQKQGSESEK